MSIDYAKNYSGVVDERFKQESKSDLVVNQDFDFVGAKTVSVQTVTTATMNDYSRTNSSNRYGNPQNLGVTSQEMTMSKDRSFSIVIDKMDNDETKRALESGKALRRQIDEVVMPEIDKYRYEKIVDGAKTTVEEALTAENIYEKITDATEKLDEASVPVIGRYLIVNPTVFKLMKQSKDIVLHTEIGQEARAKGIVAEIDGMKVIKVPTAMLKENVEFIVTHSCATVAPIKLAEYKIHTDAPGISGELLEGRFYYDAFVLNNKKDAIYVHKKEA